MQKTIEHNLRPYWHVDLKWIFGILSCLFLAITLLILDVYSITSPKVAINIVTVGAGAVINPRGSDPTASVNDIRQKMDAEKVDVFYPFPDHSIVITRQDINTLSPQEIQNKVYGKLAEAIYYNKLDTNGSGQESSLQKLGFLAVFTNQFHNSIVLPLVVSTTIFLVFLSLAIVFSAGAGRLVTPAIVMLLVTGPLAFVGLVLSALATNPQTQLGNAIDQTGRVNGAVTTTIPLIISSILGVYGWVALVAIVLLVAALVFKLVSHKPGKSLQSKTNETKDSR